MVNQNIPSETSKDWLMPEATKDTEVDRELYELLLRREALFNQALKSNNISIHDPKIAAQMDVLREQINERKLEIGIDHTQEP